MDNQKINSVGNIRKATESDADKIINIIQSSLDKEKLNKIIYGCDKSNVYLKTLISCKLDTGYRMFVYEESNQIVGYIEFKLMDNKAHINYIFIDETYRNKNIGTEFLIKTIKLLPLNIEKIELNVFKDNFIALNWYSKLGFKQINESIIIEKSIKTKSISQSNRPIILNYPQYINNYNSFGFSHMMIKINSNIFETIFIGKEYIKILDINILTDDVLLDSLKYIDKNRKLFSILPKIQADKLINNNSFIEVDTLIKMEVDKNTVLK